MMTKTQTAAGTRRRQSAGNKPQDFKPIKLPRLRLPPLRARVAFISAATLLTVWQIAASTGMINTGYFSSPIAVAQAAWELVASRELGDNAPITLFEFASGYSIAVAIGVPLGMLMGWRLRVRQTFEPVLIALYVTPSLALLPIFVLALGIGTASKIAIVFVEVLITVVVNTMAGIRETDPKLVQAARSFCANDLDVFRKVLFPSAVPTMVAGLRLGVGRGVITVIVAELYGGIGGVGVMISVYGQSFKIAELLFLVFLVGLFGYALNLVISTAERAVTPWRR